MTVLLELGRVSRRFGGLLAVNNLSLKLHAGEIVGLIGPNGAGKTTLVNLITGIMRPSAGEIRYRGERIDRVRDLLLRHAAHLGDHAREFLQIVIEGFYCVWVAHCRFPLSAYPKRPVM